MGQQQVKIPTSNHVVTLLLNKRKNLQIIVHACNQHRQMTLEHSQQYMFLELPEDVQEEFHTMKNFFRNVNDSQGTCCTGGHGHYRVEFENAKLILKKNNGKTMKISVQKVQNGSSQNMTIELQEKVVSLEDRLERQVFKDIKINRLSGQINHIDAAKNHTVPLQKHFFKLQNGFYLSLFNLNANIMSSIKHSALNPSIITHLDLSGNNLTSNALKQILGLNWVSLRKLCFDDNLLETTNNIQKLQKLTELSLAKNLLKLEAAQHLSKTTFNELKFLRVSFSVGKQSEKCWQALWSKEGRNFPKLQRLVVVHNKMLPQKIKRRFESWKDAKTSQGKDREVIYELKDLEKILSDKISSLNRDNTLNNYPQME